LWAKKFWGRHKLTVIPSGVTIFVGKEILGERHKLTAIPSEITIFVGKEILGERHKLTVIPSGITIFVGKEIWGMTQINSYFLRATVFCGQGNFGGDTYLYSLLCMYPMPLPIPDTF